MVTDGVLAGLGISSSGVDRIWRVVGPTMQGDGCGRVKFQAPLPREAQKLWHYWHPFCIENTCRHPYTLEWHFTARSTCFFKIAISGQSFSISRESMKQESCKLLATTVPVRAKLYDLCCHGGVNIGYYTILYFVYTKCLMFFSHDLVSTLQERTGCYIVTFQAWFPTTTR